MIDGSDQIIAWIGLSSVPGVGRVTFRKLVAAFGSPAAALSAPRDELIERCGIPEKVARNIASSSWEEPAAREVSRARASGVSLVSYDDPSYPQALRNTDDAPLYLYVRGDLQSRDTEAFAVVGTRTPTHYGVTMTRRLAGDLAGAGMTVVSGMARGIDTQAHTGALEAHGRTIAVLGSGIDVPYPPENRQLMDRIAASGAVISENPLGTRPESGYFPARNRIISGLSRGTVIIEASEDSGSLITADYTLRQKRILFAVPGNVSSPVSKGTNSLIKRGAVLVESATDIFQALRHTPSSGASGHDVRNLPEMSDDEARVLGFISDEPKHIDVIMAESGSNPGRLSGLLTGLELKGLVKQLAGKYFVRDLEY